MNGRMQALTLYRRAETVNALREKQTSWQEAGTVRCAISEGTGGGLAATNDLMRIDSTHTAVTWDAVQPGERLREAGSDGSGTGYEVLKVIDGGRRRMHQLFLKRVDWLT